MRKVSVALQQEEQGCPISISLVVSQDGRLLPTVSLGTFHPDVGLVSLLGEGSDRAHLLEGFMEAALQRAK